MHETIRKEFIFECDQCEFENKRKGNMIIHIQSIHDKLVKFSCSVCALKSFFKQKITAHIDCHHKQGQARVLVIGCSQCSTEIPHNICDSVIDDRRKYENRYNKTKKKIISNSLKSNLNKYNCKLCIFVAHSNKTMYIHMNTNHQNDKLFDCDSCEYKCNWLPNLRTHQRAKHSGTKYECELCGWKTGGWKPWFFEHKRVFHGIFQKYSKYKTDLEHTEDLCDLCGFTANSKRSMRLHKTSDCKMTSNPSVKKTYKLLGKRTKIAHTVNNCQEAQRN